MEKREVTIVVELKDVRPTFRIDAYAAGVAYRALPWAGQVRVTENGKRLIEMDRRDTNG